MNRDLQYSMDCERLDAAAVALERLAIVQACHVLDTPGEVAYENLASLAARVCNVPMALLTILDKDRQWFKASTGVQVKETSFAGSICVNTLLGDGEFIVNDAQNDARVNTCEAVTGPMQARAYAGIGIEVHGQRVGAMCVIDTKPREWSEDEKRCLRMLASQFAELLRSRIVAEELRQAHVQGEHIVDTQHEMLARLDTNLRIVYANRAICHHLGHTREELVGKSVLELSPVHEHEQVKEHFREILRTRDSRSTEQTVLCADGSEQTHRWTDSPIMNAKGEVVGYQSWGWDMTELRQREHALQQAHEGLVKVNDELREKNAEVLQLTFALTHDLQTPLATLTGQLSLLEQAKLKGKPVDTHVDRMRASVDRLTRMLTDLLTYARAGSEQTRAELVDVQAVVRSVTEEIAPLAAEKQVLLGFDDLGSNTKMGTGLVLADREAIRRVMSNLIGNAVKYTSQRVMGERRVIVRVLHTQQKVRVCVMDNGPGVPPPLLDQVFLPFKRVSKDSTGTGLGLSIVKKYVEMFGGRVWLESDGQNGTTASVEFNVARASSLAA